MSLKIWFIPFVFVFFALSGCGGDDGDPVQFTKLQITASENPIPLGFQSQLTATAFYSDGHSYTTDATWESMNEDIAKVDTAGLVSTASNTGEVTIKATTAEGSGTFLLTVTSATLKAIELTPYSEEVSYSEETPLGINVDYKAQGIFSDGSEKNISNHPDLVWKSTVGSVAIIVKGSAEDEFARSDTLSTGTTVFTAVLGITSNEVNLIVNDHILQSISISPERVSRPLGVVKKFRAEGLFSDGITRNISADVNWSSTSIEQKVLELVDERGVFKGIALGSANVSATYSNAESNNGEISSDNQPLFVVELMEMTGFTVDSPNSEDTQPLGKKVQFIAMATFTNGHSYDVSAYEQVHWQSSNTGSDTGIATVTNSGLVTGEGLGSVTITASTDFDNATASKAITITAAEVESVHIEPVDDNLIITEGKTQQYDAWARYTNGTIYFGVEGFTWSQTTSLEDNTSSFQDHPNAEINSDGLLTYHSVGDNPGFANIFGDFLGVIGETSLALPIAELIGVPNDSPLQEFIGVLTEHEADHLFVEYSDVVQESGSDAFNYVTMSHSQAVQYCELLLYNGNDDWQLPSSGDLETLWLSEDGVDDSVVFSAGWVFGTDYWSKTESDDGHEKVSLVDGNIATAVDNEFYYASCVRSVQ